MTEENIIEATALDESAVSVSADGNMEEVAEPASIEATEENASEKAEDTQIDVNALKSELDELRAMLAKKEEEQSRLIEEMSEFSRLFPNVSVGNIPDEVKSRVKSGIPLCAAYALYEKKREALNLRANEINARNAHTAAGSAGKNTSGEYFSPDEVRTMSRKEVHENFSKIKNSMKFWR